MVYPYSSDRELVKTQEQGYHKVFIYLLIFLFYLFIYLFLFICLFVCVFIYLFILEGAF